MNSWHENDYMIGTHNGLEGIPKELGYKIFTPENYTSPHYPMERE